MAAREVAKRLEARAPMPVPCHAVAAAAGDSSDRSGQSAHRSTQVPADLAPPPPAAPPARRCPKSRKSDLDRSTLVRRSTA